MRPQTRARWITAALIVLGCAPVPGASVRPGRLIPVRPPVPGQNCFAINNLRQVVGNGRTANGFRAYMWLATPTLVRLGPIRPPGNFSDAAALNDRGEVVGSVGPVGGARAALWIGRRFTDLGTLGGAQAVAWDINESTEVAGTTVTQE
jgi:uncharacterized membrane protein